MTTYYFDLTDEHVLLLSNAYVRWEDCEFGAPAIDCKRPYGNSKVLDDMREILAGTERTDGELNVLHHSLETALQVVLNAGSFVVGQYRKDDYGQWAQWAWNEGDQL